MARNPEDPRPPEALDRLTWSDPRHLRENDAADRADTAMENQKLADEPGRSAEGIDRTPMLTDDQRVMRQPDPDLENIGEHGDNPAKHIG